MEGDGSPADVLIPVEVAFAALAAAVHPDWHDAIQRLANAITCVSCQLDQLRETQDGATFVKRCGSLITTLIDVLDEINPDPDLEPWLGFPEGFRFGPTTTDDREAENEHDEDGGDDEPSLGSHEIREAGAVSYAFRPLSTYAGTYFDCEEQCDDEGVQDD